MSNMRDHFDLFSKEEEIEVYRDWVTYRSTQQKGK